MQDPFEADVRGAKFRIRRLPNAFELMSLVSRVGALAEIRGRYEYLKRQLQEKLESSAPPDQVEAFSALSQLDQGFLETVERSMSRAVAFLMERTLEGDWGRLTVEEAADLVNRYVAAHTLTESQQGN